MSRSSRIEGRATPIIDTSIASRKSAPQRTRSIPHARAPSCSTVLAWEVVCAVIPRCWPPEGTPTRSVFSKAPAPPVPAPRASAILDRMATAEILHEPALVIPLTQRNGAQLRRRELGAFVRSRRERLKPEHVGLRPTRRRRTPGLRREEVAQLAGVGVTWYTWLGQGRDIHPSAQVLATIATTLQLHAHE